MTLTAFLRKAVLVAAESYADATFDCLVWTFQSLFVLGHGCARRTQESRLAGPENP